MQRWLSVAIARGLLASTLVTLHRFRCITNAVEFPEGVKCPSVHDYSSDCWTLQYLYTRERTRHSQNIKLLVPTHIFCCYTKHGERTVLRVQSFINAPTNAARLHTSLAIWWAGREREPSTRPKINGAVSSVIPNISAQQLTPKHCSLPLSVFAPGQCVRAFVIGYQGMMYSLACRETYVAL